MRLDLELYKENGVCGIYISDNIGGSGITAEGATPKEAAENAAGYLADYLSRI